MAFTTAQLAQIRSYLGYPSVWLFLDPRLEGTMQVVGNDPDASGITVTILGNLAAIDAALMGTAVPSAGVHALSGADVELFEGKQKQELCDHGRMWCSRLSSLFGVPLAGDVYGRGGSGGFGWAKGQRSTLAGLG